MDKVEPQGQFRNASVNSWAMASKTGREGLTFTVTDSLAGIEGIENNWQDLWNVCSHATPFQASGWLVPYLRVFKPGPIRFLSIWRDRFLIALFPFFVDHSGDTRVLRILGQGLSDYLDGLCREGDRSAVAGLVELWLTGELACCEYAEFNQLRPGAVLSSIPRPNVFKEEVVEGAWCPVVRLPPQAGAAALPVSVSLQRNIELSVRQLRKLGSIRFQIADHSSIDWAISNLFQLHAKRWQHRGLPGVFDTLNKKNFYREALRNLKRSSAGELFTLFLDDKPIASFAALRKEKVFYYYIGAFDPDYSKFGPGNLLIKYALEFAIRADYQSFDFLRGCELYKYKWGAENQKTTIRRLWRGRR